MKNTTLNIKAFAAIIVTTIALSSNALAGNISSQFFAQPTAVSTPDGGATIALLAVGMTGLLAIRRKFKR